MVEGDFEILANGEWRKALPGQAIYQERGSVHTFHNVGAATGKILVFVAPAGLEKYLEEISSLSLPQDMPQLLAISERYGISFQI